MIQLCKSVYPFKRFLYAIADMHRCSETNLNRDNLRTADDGSTAAASTWSRPFDKHQLGTFSNAVTFETLCCDQRTYGSYKVLIVGCLHDNEMH